MSQQLPEEQLQMDAGNLFREETFTDQQVGTIRRLTPVDDEGADDADREVRYIGSTQVLTPAGALPLSFELEANSLTEAAEKFADAARQALEETMEELKEYQRQAASSIVVPKPGEANLGGDGAGGGKIKMP